uniref:PH and SEC7 domain-containing protein 1-like n=1 Tax=Dermatophagoides pteronyssinus TaxID=6956 RepID=A0A6P6YDJ1_DERPT|nr:PH and SEC7 domain-containing protein 1-like [Dermatophagoides pteronyssinus]
MAATTTSPNNQDWFLMTGDLIINLRSTKTGDTNNILKGSKNRRRLSSSSSSSNVNGKKNLKKFHIENDVEMIDSILDDNQNQLESSTIKSFNDDCDCLNSIRSNLEQNLQHAKETDIDHHDNGYNNDDDLSTNNLKTSTTTAATTNNTNTIQSLSSKISNSLSSTTTTTTTTSSSSSSGNVSSGILCDDDVQLQEQEQEHHQLPQQQQQQQQQQSIKPPSSNCSSDYQHFSFFDHPNDQQEQQKHQLDHQQQQQSEQKQENCYENIGDCRFKSQESNLYNLISDDNDDDDGNYSRSMDELSIGSDESSLLYYSTPSKFNGQQQQGIDTPSASRLAKRLYNLEGFKKSDVARHLSKNNEFCRTVAEEYLKLFNFSNQELDVSLRYFLSYFHLIGETQERERVLVYFSKRYYECNPNTEFKSIDSIHTLTCALMLLNTDLHEENIHRKMTCSNFIFNLAGMNDGDDYPNNLLKYLYYSVKNNPLGWLDDEDHPRTITKSSTNRNVFAKITTISKSISSPYATLPRKFNQQLSSSSSMISTTISSGIATTSPFIDLPNPLVAIEYKKGYIRRKCCYDSNGRKTSIGKRSWKLFYATLRDLVLYLHKDENGFRKLQLQECFANSIRIHHSIASKADDYPKKKFVFRLITADYAEYLFETSDSKELQSWIETINTTAASLSAPTLPMAVCSDSRKFKKEIFPVSHTKLSLREQLKDQENKLLSLQKDLEQLLEKSCQNIKYRKGFMEKENYLQHEIKRYRVYVSCLRRELKKLPIQSSNDLQQPQQQHNDDSSIHSQNHRQQQQQSLTVNHHQDDSSLQFRCSDDSDNSLK